MIYQFRIDGETPSKKNSRINLPSGVSIPSKKYTEWNKNAILQLKSELREENKLDAPLSSPVSISLLFIHGDKRRRDSDNGCSSIMDTLVDANILDDDNWNIVRSIYITNDYKKSAPSCAILIKTLENDTLF